MTSPVDKQKFLHDVFAILITISDIAIQDHYLNQIADSIHTRYEILATQYKKYTATDGKLYIRQLQKPKKEKYTLDREGLLTALLIDDTIGQYIDKEHPRSVKLLDLIKKLSAIASNTTLQKIQTNNFTPKEQQEIQQMQLRWENALWTLHTPEERYGYIRQFAMPLLQKYIKNMLADKNITPQQKQEILKMKSWI